MIASGDKVQASCDAVSAGTNLCGLPQNVPALRVVPHPGKSKQESPAPSTSRAIAATPPLFSTSTPAWQQPKLLDRLRESLRSRHYSQPTEQADCHWVKRLIFFFHDVRHPAATAEPEINAFLTHLTVKEKVSASTQNQAQSVLLFLYRHILSREIGELGDVIWARRPKRVPLMFTREELRAVLGNLTGDKWLMASRMYGVGLRLLKCLQRRVPDVVLAAKQITGRDGKGFQDRRTMLPDAVIGRLREHLARVRQIH